MSEGLGITDVPTENYAPIALTVPLDLGDFLEAELLVERHEMCSRDRGIQRKPSIPLLTSPRTARGKQSATKAKTLETGTNSDLVDDCNVRLGVVSAVAALVRSPNGRGAEQPAVFLSDEARTTSDAFGRNVWALIDCCVVQAHRTKTCIGLME